MDIAWYRVTSYGCAMLSIRYQQTPTRPRSSVSKCVMRMVLAISFSPQGIWDVGCFHHALKGLIPPNPGLFSKSGLVIKEVSIGQLSRQKLFFYSTNHITNYYIFYLLQRMDAQPFLVSNPTVAVYFHSNTKALPIMSALTKNILDPGVPSRQIEMESMLRTIGAIVLLAAPDGLHRVCLKNQFS